MKLSFVPGALYLTQRPDGKYVVTLKSEDVIVTSSMKTALAKYNALRKSLEVEHPATELSADERAALLRKEIGEALVDENHYAPQQLKKGKKTTRTFG